MGLLALGVVGGCLGLLEDPTPSTPIEAPTTVADEVDSASSTVGIPWTSVATLSAPTTPPEGTVTHAGAGGSVDEIDCEQAEELADWSEFEAGDIADYCDYGPDPGELPDEFDWDE